MFPSPAQPPGFRTSHIPCTSVHSRNPLHQEMANILAIPIIPITTLVPTPTTSNHSHYIGIVHGTTFRTTVLTYLFRVISHDTAMKAFTEWQPRFSASSFWIQFKSERRRVRSCLVKHAVGFGLLTSAHSWPALMP
jgi:hypothetical protein